MRTFDLVRNRERLYHELLADPEVEEVRRSVQSFAERHIYPRAHEIAVTAESVAAFPSGEFGAMAAEGLFRIPFARASGGTGLARPALATIAVIEELAYFSNSIAAIYDVHCILSGHALEAGGGDIADRVLPELIDGRAVVSFATSEPGASSDLSPAALGVVAEPSGDGWRLSGTKRWITNSPVANWIIALARTGQNTTLFLVDTRAPGVRIGAPDKKMGNHAQLTADVTFDDVEVASANLVGSEGAGLRIALRALTYGRIGIGSAGVGMAQRAFDEAVGRLRDRAVFGKPLATYQHWQFTFASHAMAIDSARNLCAKAASRLDAGERPEPEAAMAKISGTSAAVDLARDAVQVFGGYGFASYVEGDQAFYPIEAIYRDAKIGEIYEGANEIQRWLIAREIFGRELVG
jgi:alkylation response protein AidB-like acyl-CoA dehydrogenase